MNGHFPLNAPHGTVSTHARNRHGRRAGDLHIEHIMPDSTPAFRRTAIALTAAGALPFIGLTVAMAVLAPPQDSFAGPWLLSYAAMILSFLGGIRWGIAVGRSSAGAGALALSVLPALAAWIILPLAAVFRPSPYWILAFAALFVLQLIWDLVSRQMPAWFKPVRLGVSLVVIASLGAAWAIRVFGG